MRCPKCSNETPSGKFCAFCGAIIETPVAPVTAAVSAEPEKIVAAPVAPRTPVVPETYDKKTPLTTKNGQPIEIQPPEKEKKVITKKQKVIRSIIYVVVLLLAAGIGVVAGMVSNALKTEEKKEESFKWGNGEPGVYQQVEREPEAESEEI